MKLTKNFSKKEFDCKCGCDMPQDVLESVQKLSVQLQVVRNTSNAPISINSAYRCPSHNKAIGGVKNSQHILGKAADIRIKGLTADEVADLIESLYNKGEIQIGGLGRYNSFTHVDIRNSSPRWDKRR